MPSLASDAAGQMVSADAVVYCDACIYEVFHAHVHAVLDAVWVGAGDAEAEQALPVDVAAVADEVAVEPIK